MDSATRLLFGNDWHSNKRRRSSPPDLAPTVCFKVAENDEPAEPNTSTSSHNAADSTKSTAPATADKSGGESGNKNDSKEPKPDYKLFLEILQQHQKQRNSRAPEVPPVAGQKRKHSVLNDGLMG